MWGPLVSSPRIAIESLRNKLSTDAKIKASSTGQAECSWLAGASTVRCSSKGQGIALGQQRAQPTHQGVCQPGCTDNLAQALPEHIQVHDALPLQ